MKKKVIIFSAITLYCLGLIIALVYYFVKKAETEAAVEKIRFDLSQYEDHGELSCGRIWCSKIEGDWNTPNVEKFAYFDCYGNQISQWFNSDSYNSPSDYKNNYVILTQIKTPPIQDYYPVTILNIDGNIIANLTVKYYHYGGANYLGISDFNSDGIACCYARGANYEDTLYWIDSSGEHKFNINDNDVIVRSYSPDSLKAEKLGDDIVLYLGGSYNYYTAIFSKNGDLVLDVKKAIGGYEIHNISKDGTNLNVAFIGADNKTYHCVIDYSGNLINEPY